MASPGTTTGAQRREQILHAATKVFARAGVQKARMDDLAVAVGVSKPALYLYFPSKDAIVEALMHRLFDVELAELRDLERVPGPVAKRLLAFNERVLRQYQAMAVRAPLVREFYALAGRDRRVATGVRKYLTAVAARLEALVAQGVRSGELRRVSPRAVATTILALYEGLMVLWAADPSAVRWDVQAKEALELLLRGLVRPGR
jgi:AcrR family transcriptional regulator